MRNIYIIVNPKSGKYLGLSILDLCKQYFLENHIEFTVGLSEYKNHPYYLANQVDLSKYNSLAVIGGDGTMHEVLNGMLQREDKITLPIGLITAGTGNSLMHDLDALNPKTSIWNIIEGKTRLIDIISITSADKSYYAFNIIGWGIPVDINQVSEKLRWLGGQRYNVASLIEIIRNRSRQIKITIDNQIIDDDVSFFLTCNTMYTGNGMKMSPESKIDDGLMNVFYVKKASRLKLLSLFTKVFSGRHTGDPILHSFLAKKIKIESELIHELNIDGQLGYSSPIEAKMTGLQLEIFC